MADSVEGPRFWLPSEFLDDCLTDKENPIAESDSEFCFPTEFPYDFGTKNDEQLQKRWVMSTSPQSTLAHMEIWAGRSTGGSSNGSPNGVTSPPTTPSGARNDAVGDLIYLAAGRVATLKLNGGAVRGSTKPKALIGPPKNPNPSVIRNIYLEQQKQGYEMWYSEPRMYQTGHDALPVQYSGRNGASAVPFGGGGDGTAVKRECAGTGVFLPRRYGTSIYSSDSRKRAVDGSSGILAGKEMEPVLSLSLQSYPSASLPNRNVNAQNNFNNMNAFPQSQPQFQPKFNRAGLVPDYDMLMAKRNMIMLQHRSSLMSRGLYLPQEWTY